MTPYFDPAGLRAGDVLLMKGISAVSDLIAWFGDSIYSHAAIMVDGASFVEAALPKSRLVLLADRLRQTDHYDFVEAYRPTRSSGEPLDAADRSRLDSTSRAYLEVNYPLNSLVQMAIFAGLRKRVPADKKLRWLLDLILNHVIKFDPENMVCSELVYAAMSKAELAPALIVSAQLDLPMPKIDVLQLYREWQGASGREAITAGEAVAAEVSELDETELLATYARLHQHLGSELPAARATEGSRLGMPPILNPNPKNVLPVDLETSPQLRLLGRLPLRA